MDKKADRSHYKYSVEIPTDEYADLLSVRTRFDILCDVIENQPFVNKDELLLIARGASSKVKEHKTLLIPSASDETESL